MEEQKFIDIRRLIASKNPKLLKWIPGFVIGYLKRVLHQEEINQFLKENKDKKNEAFCDAVLNYFNVQLETEGLENVPDQGRIVLAMNHPLGGMDAMALVSVLQHKRTDLKFIVNDLLMNLENLKDLFVGVDKHARNSGSVRDQIQQLFESDQAICIFPAGLVSRKTHGEVRDLEWKKTFVTLSRKTDRTIIPVFIDGTLSKSFYRLANFRKKLGIKANIEMLYLSDELFKQRNKRMKLIFGKPIYAGDLDPDKNDREIAGEIREVVYKLPNQGNLS